jgi:hypothetical protein
LRAVRLPHGAKRTSAFMGPEPPQSDMLTSQDAILRRGDVSNRREADIPERGGGDAVILSQCCRTWRSEAFRKPFGDREVEQRAEVRGRADRRNRLGAARPASCVDCSRVEDGD